MCAEARVEVKHVRLKARERVEIILCRMSCPLNAVAILTSGRVVSAYSGEWQKQREVSTLSFLSRFTPLVFCKCCI